MLAFRNGIIVDNKKQLAIKVQQCLFGYEDGHRLLASSMQLPSDVESMLLRFSDLAPGANDFDIKSYWTGLPLASINSYALLRTWPATEMPRPGCVWTHVLLIGFSDIARFVDLSIFEQYSVRPTLNSQYDEYSEPVLIDVTRLGSIENFSDSKLSYNNLLKVIRAVYSSDEESYLFSEANELDSTVFRIWSQQWPRLRRSFSFRTVGSLSEKTTTGMDFDFRVLSYSDNHLIKSDQPTPLEPKLWEEEAIKDSLSLEPTEFRRFLWRYGSDINDGRTRFNFLADLYVSTHQNTLLEKKHEDILLRVAKMLPEPEDGKALKSDLIEGEKNEYSLIPAVDPLESLAFFIMHPDEEGLSPLAYSTFPDLKKLWLTRSDEIVVLAEKALKKKLKLSKSILSQLVALTEADSFLESTHGKFNLRYSLISEKPLLLNTDSLLNVEQPDLSMLLDLLPDDQQLAEQVIERLVFLNDRNVAEEMFTRFPKLVTRVVVKAINQISGRVDDGFSIVWFQVISEYSYDILNGGYIENIHSMNVLVIFAEALGYRNPDVINAGPLPWTFALVNAKKDIDGKVLDKLYAFLLMLAIEKPLQGCESIFEYTFDHIHSAFANNKLSGDAQSIIEKSLPNLRWWKQWDMCHRLRIAVVKAYVNNKLDQKSFNRLASSKKTTNNLVDIARKTKKGRDFLEKKKRSLKKKKRSHKIKNK